MRATKEVILKCILYLLPVLFIWQGLDFTDMGYSLSNALFFDQPGVIQGQPLAYFLTNFIGWVWLKISGPFGLIGARFGWCVIMWGIFYLSNEILSKIMPGWRSLLFLSLTFLFVRAGAWINYNDLSALFALASLLLVIKGESHDGMPRLFYVFVAGFIIGLNIFVRIPNILMLSFAFIPVVADVIGRKSLPRKECWASSAVFVCGTIVAAVIVLLLMSAFGYLDYYLDSIAYIKSLADDPNSHHGGLMLITLFVNNHIDVFRATLILGGKIASASFIIVLLPWHSVRYACAVLVAGYFYKRYGYYSFIYVLAGISYIAVFIKLATAAGKSRREVILIYLSALGLFMCLPLGSSNGIINIVCSSWLMIPLVLNIIYTARLSSIFDSAKKYMPQKFNHILQQFHYDTFVMYARNIFIMLFIFICISHAWTYTYRDSAERSTMRYSVNHEKLRFTYTTSARAKAVQELLDAMEFVTKQYEYMLAYDIGCTLHYLLDIKPYMFETWEFSYEPDLFKEYLNKAELEHPLPIVVKTKETFQSRDWPQKVNPYWNNSERYKHNRAIMDNFLIRYFYVKTWENDVFEVWQPKGGIR